MSFPRYPEYKDSGIEWLGEVPVHWGLMLLKRDVKFITSGARGWAENYADDGDIFIRIGNLTRDSTLLDLSDIQRVSVPDSAEVSRTQVQPGDVLFSITAYLGSVAVIPEEIGRAFVSQHVALVRLSKKHFLPEWVAYLTISYVGKTYLETVGYGGTKIQLSLADVTGLPVLVPPIQEQATLVGFLDHEVLKIDGLIAEQEKLIALLKEKRQAVISHAVTKGLDPNVPMKDSGIEWLGEVPAHWDITLIKRLGTIRYGIGEPPRYQEDGTPLIRATNVHAGKLLNKGLVFVDPSDIPSQRIVWLDAGDIIVVRSGAYTGDSAIIPGSYGSCIAGFDMVLRLHSCMPAFGQYVLLSSYLKDFQIELKRMRAAQPHLNAEELGECIVVLPPAIEQSMIVSFLDEETSKIDLLLAEAQKGIDLLKERRSALISAVVTGKIDVRSTVTAQVA